jgi:hypothetical protein
LERTADVCCWYSCSGSKTGSGKIFALVNSYFLFIPNRFD